MKAITTLHRLDIATIAATLAIFALAIGVAMFAPHEPIPVHFDIHGVPDRYESRDYVVNLILFMGVMLGATGGAMGWFAARTDDEARARGLRAGQLVSALTVGSVTVFMVAAMLGGGGGLSTILMTVGLSLILICLGAFLGRVGPNILIGVRTPWSFKSKLAWERSNRLAGRLFLALGVLSLVIAPFTPQPYGFGGIVVGIIVIALWSTFESWRVWRTDPNRQPF